MAVLVRLTHYLPKTVIRNKDNDMKLIAAFLTFFTLLPAISFAQNMVAWPVDEAAKDPSFLAYREALLETVKARNTEAFLKFVDPGIHLSFGGDVGHEAMRRSLNLSANDLSEEYKSQAEKLRREYWHEIEKVLILGGRFDEGAFVAPYTWQAKIPKDANAYQTYFVIGSNVLLRTNPNANAPIITRLSYNIVYNNVWQEDTDYQAVHLPDGQKGYLSSQYLRSLIDYRASFIKTNGRWQMVMFIAGD